MIMFLYLMLCFMLPNIIWLLMNKAKLMRKKMPSLTSYGQSSSGSIVHWQFM